MYNSNVPSRAELPSSKQLMRSTIIAAVVAAVLLITVVLPSEYGKDLTGIGRVLGLTEMGQIKVELAKEAAADAAAAESERSAASVQSGAGAAPVAVPAAPVPARAPVAVTPAPASSSAATGSNWRDNLSVTLTPGQGIEIKLVMQEGEKATFSWAVEGGVVNYDTHGDGSGRSISYVKGRAVQADEGELVAAFTGNHGWFWRNRGKEDVKLTLRTGGQYSALKRP